MAKKTTKTEAEKPAPIISYKGFDASFACRNHQFEVGKTYKVSGEIVACKNGFHACENPLDVWSYYGLFADDGNLTRYALVEQSGTIARHGENTKIASAEITIKAELSLPDFLKRSIEWLIASCKDSSGEKVQAASGDYSQLAASGDSSRLAASGDYSQLAASGDSSQLAASGDSSQLAASGDYSRLAASGGSSRLAASGDSSQLAASGDYSQLAASGGSSRLAASGYYSRLAASGDYSQLAASGDSSQLAASGENSVICTSAPGCTAKGATGTHMAVAEFKKGKCVGFATGCVGENGIKADTWYRAEDGKLVEVEE